MSQQQLQLLSVYRSMLAAAGFEVTSDGFARVLIEDGEYLPVLGKDGHQVVIPEAGRLSEPGTANYEIFHLLSENSKVNNSSDLLTRYRHWLISRLNIVIGGLGGIMLSINADEALSKRLRPDQADFTKLLVGADQETANRFDKVAQITAKPNQLQRVFISMYIRNTGVLDKKSYGRIATVSFPFFDEVKKIDDEHAAAKKDKTAQKQHKSESEIYGVPMRIKDRDAFMGVMHYLLPDLDTKHSYDVGSNSKIAPSVDALMRAFYPIAKHLNDVGEMLKGLDPGIDSELEEMKIELDWIEAFENLDALWPQIRLVPQQNTATSKEPEDTTPHPAAARAAAPTPMPAPVNTPPWNPTPTPAPVAQGSYPMPAPSGSSSSSSGGGVSVADMMARSMQAQRHLAPPPNQGGYGYPQQTQYPGMAPQYPSPMQSPYGQPQQPQGMYPSYGTRNRY